MKTEFGNERVARERDSWRWSVFPWFELECHTVDAKPLTCRPRSIRKHMAQVSFALEGEKPLSLLNYDRPTPVFDIRMWKKPIASEFDYERKQSPAVVNSFLLYQ